MGFWLAKFVFLGPLLRLIWRPWIEGAENIPDDRPAILASNHLSFCDSFFLPLMAPRKVTFLAKSEYFTTPGLKGLISKMFFAGVGQVPIDRDDDAYFEPLRELQLPEGTEVYVGLVHFRDGVDGARRRAAAAGRFLAQFGVATECGMGRRPEGRGSGDGELDQLLSIHREIAEPIRTLR